MATNTDTPGDEAPNDIYLDATETEVERERRLLQATLNRVISARVRAEDVVIEVIATGVRPERAISWESDEGEDSDSSQRSPSLHRNRIYNVMRVYAALIAVAAFFWFLYSAGLTSAPSTPAGSEVLAQWRRTIASMAGATLVVILVLQFVGQIQRAELRQQLSGEL